MYHTTRVKTLECLRDANELGGETKRQWTSSLAT